MPKREAVWTRWGRRWMGRLLTGVLGLWLAASAAAQTGSAGGEPAWGSDIQAWIERLHDATRNRAYSGTFVVSRGSEIVAARIAHVCDGRQQIERIEALNGQPRVTWRRDDEVMTLLPDKQWAIRDRRELLRLFPGPLRVPGIQVADHYRAEVRRSERLAGFDAWVVEFLPRDALRYGYRIWSEKRSGLVLKMQTLKADGDVLEQMVFTELQLDAPLRVDAMARQMDDTRGYRIERPTLRKTTPEAEGWRLRSEVPGFQPITCWARAEEPGRPKPPLQCVFSDGLTSVSLFFSVADGPPASRSQAGATHALSQRVGNYGVTALGEVPQATLERFLGALERVR